MSTCSIASNGCSRLFSAQARIDAADSKTEPSMQPLTVLREVDLICHLWQRYVTMALLPLASSSVTVRREMVVFNNQAVSRIEGGANQVTQKLTDGACRDSCMFMPEGQANLTCMSSHRELALCTTGKAEAYRFQAEE